MVYKALRFQAPLQPLTMTLIGGSLASLLRSMGKLFKSIDTKWLWQLLHGHWHLTKLRIMTTSVLQTHMANGASLVKRPGALGQRKESSVMVMAPATTTLASAPALQASLVGDAPNSCVRSHQKTRREECASAMATGFATEHVGSACVINLRSRSQGMLGCRPSHRIGSQMTIFTTFRELKRIPHQ